MKNTILIIILIAALRSPAQVSSAKHSALGDKIVAVVGDQIILASEIQQLVSDRSRNSMPTPANANCIVTEQAIISRLLLLQALKDSLKVETEVEAELDNSIRSWITRLGSKSKLEEYFGKPVEQIKNDSRQAVTENKMIESMREKIVGNLNVAPAEVKAYYDKIPQDSLPMLEPEAEVGQIIFYPGPSVELENYVINELSNYKKQVENKVITFCSTTTDANSCNDYDINRNNKGRDPAFVNAAFRLKKDEISGPVKGKFGFYLIQMIDREGDDAKVRYVFRSFPLTDAEINQTKFRLGKLRSDIINGHITFNAAATEFSDDEQVTYSGGYFTGVDGTPVILVSELDKEVAAIVNKMSGGDISLPMLFIDKQNRKGLRLIYLKSRSAAHLLSLRDDYSKVASMALEQKKANAIDRWIKAAAANNYVMIDDEWGNNCPAIKKYENAEKASQVH